MKKLDTVIKTVLKEQSEMYFLTSANGGTLGIPKSSQPTDIYYVDLGAINSNLNDENFLMNKFGKWGQQGGTPIDVCKAYHPKEDLLECLQSGYRTYSSNFKRGGVTKFTALNPLSNKRETYTSCWARYGKNTIGALTLSDFEKWNFSGYFPKTRGIDCYGQPWGGNLTKDNKNKTGDIILSSGRLEINLLTLKNS
jgi:hypothetical protein